MSFTSFTKSLLTACLGIAISCGSSFAQDAEQVAESKEDAAIRVVLNEDGALQGRVFAMVGSEETPMLAKVSLASDGKTVASSDTDVIGNFSFSDVEPGTYTMVGVSGEYVGDQVVVVSAASDEEAKDEDGEDEDEADEGVYTSLALQVAPVGVYSDAGFVDSYAGVPMDSFAAPVSECSSCGSVDSFSSCGSCGGSSYSACGGCGGGFGGGGGIGGGGGLLGGGSSLRRLAILGTAVAIPVALSGGPSSPDE